MLGIPSQLLMPLILNVCNPPQLLSFCHEIQLLGPEQSYVAMYEIAQQILVYGVSHPSIHMQNKNFVQPSRNQVMTIESFTWNPLRGSTGLRCV